MGILSLTIYSKNKKEEALGIETCLWKWSLVRKCVSYCFKFKLIISQQNYWIMKGNNKYTFNTEMPCFPVFDMDVVEWRMRPRDNPGLQYQALNVSADC